MVGFGVHGVMVMGRGSNSGVWSAVDSPAALMFIFRPLPLVPTALLLLLFLHSARGLRGKDLGSGLSLHKEYWGHI